MVDTKAVPLSEGQDDEYGAEFAAPGACAAELLCDRHAGTTVAFRVVEPDLSFRDLTFAELEARSRRVAAALAARGVGRGDAVGVLMGKSAELPSVLLGLWRLGAVHVPLFTAFARNAIELRLTGSSAAVVIADADQVGKLEGEPDAPLPPWQVIQVGGRRPETAGWHLLDDLVAEAPEPGAAESERVGADGTLILLFTSGTTGTPKAVPVPLRALASMRRYLLDALDLRDDDVYWNAADPGWAYGLYYAILGPLALGRTSILLRAGFSAPVTWDLLDRFQVTNFAAAPTIYRALRAEPSASQAPTRLRCASSAGEPLTPEVVSWSRGALGTEVRDHYGQTELGMVAGNAWREELRAPVVSGSMGYSLPGWSCAVLAEDSDEQAPPGIVGRLAVDVRDSPLMWFPGYAGAPERTAERYTPDGRWYLTGDTAARDAEGRLYFSSRDDDVIIMAGYRIGPFDVESVLVTHESVAEAAVVGAPDPLRGEVIEAYVVLKRGIEGSPELEAELQRLVKSEYAAHAYPRRVHVVGELPKTPSGKIQRYVLRALAKETEPG
ncbi:AMP-dependent synthetase [Prauserella marina]|uniref:Acetyl-CoA synthetase n=1 Tax=Prauserella marina TaxID=530584 RepID=A0A222VU01_9PSEU|nr:AMP-binding protein [Prauserella marina]ASR37213.1 AMP-dependent synthetase [Prauserella marina]PWV72531.1 acetyl-CoA synthetase [Prauserella marina]SDD77826.1 acetyl-CoA synthetase [Prauserella marina]